jgi:hypothetical protein
MAEGLWKSAAVPVPSADPCDPAVPAKVVTVAPELLVLLDPPQDASITAIEMMIPTNLKRSFTITSYYLMFGIPDFRFEEFYAI